MQDMYDTDKRLNVRPVAPPAELPRLRDVLPEPTRPILLGVALFAACVLLALFGLSGEARYLGALLITLPALAACWV